MLFSIINLSFPVIIEKTGGSKNTNFHSFVIDIYYIYQLIQWYPY